MGTEYSIKKFRNGTLRLLGLTSGEATLKAPAVAGAIEITLPDATDTLIGRASNDTLTGLKKHIVAGANSDIEFGDSIGVYGDSTTPSYGFNATLVSGDWKYKVNGFAVLLQVDTATGSWLIYTAPSGTAGNSVSWTLKETITTAGVLSINEIASTKISPRLVNVTESATPAINTDITDIAYISGINQNITNMSTNLTGTPSIGQQLRILFLDDNGGYSLAWGASFADGNTGLPINIQAGVTLSTLFDWDNGTGVWRCMLASNA